MDVLFASGDPAPLEPASLAALVPASPTVLSPEPEPPLVAVDRARLAEDRSFFAQPEPLKWIAGVTSALRIVASVPQLGQKRGPGSLIPWITSTRCRQLEQT